VKLSDGEGVTIPKRPRGPFCRSVDCSKLPDKQKGPARAPTDRVERIQS
jgi:hypothetical protein